MLNLMDSIKTDFIKWTLRVNIISLKQGVYQVLLEHGKCILVQYSIDSINKPQSIAYLRRCKGRRIIQVKTSFLSLKPNGKVRAEKATFSVTKLHAVVVAHKPSYSCVAKHDEYNWSL